MKIFRTVGVAAALLAIVSAYLPWVYIDAGTLHGTLSGMNTRGSNFGEPGLLTITFAILFLLSAVIPRVWAKRAGLFFAVVIVAWNIRNLALFTRCEMGYCPVLRVGMYLTLVASAAIMLAAVLPYMPPREKA